MSMSDLHAEITAAEAHDASTRPAATPLTLAQAVELQEAMVRWQAHMAATVDIPPFGRDGDVFHARGAALPRCPACQAEPSEVRWRDGWTFPLRDVLEIIFLPCEHFFEATGAVLYGLHQQDYPS